jgi:hypothetical protein
MKRLLPLLALSLLLVSGCITAEQARMNRIQDHQDTFLLLSEEARQRAQAGTIAIGDPPAVAWFAFGEPDRRGTNTTADGTAEVWQYTRTVSEPYQVLVYDPPPPPPPYPHRPPPPRAHWETHYNYSQVVSMQISFVNGAAAQIQTF